MAFLHFTATPEICNHCNHKDAHMDQKEYAYHLGSLLVNFQSLEFVLRAFLYQHQNTQSMGIPDGQDMYATPIGGKLRENAFTNYDSLGALIKKFNASAASNAESNIDESLVDIRDALAHGRASAAQPTDTMRILKFSKPEKGNVTVTFNAVLSKEWFVEQIRRVRDAVLIVAAKLNPPQTVF